jgi:TRAP-type C4-dicarboxylate transport system permease small subunit
MEADAETVIAVAETVGEFYGQAMVAMSLYVTAVSGYLLVSYFVGPRLTRFQAIIFTCLFLFFSGFMTFGAYGFFKNANYFGVTYGRGLAPQWTDEVAVTLMFLGILASLKFMWDIRHGKAE